MEDKDYKRLCVILIVIIGIIIVFYCSNKYIDYEENKEIEMNQTMIQKFNNGAQYGYLMAIAQTISNSQDCKIVPLQYENFSVSLVDIKCVG